MSLLPLGDVCGHPGNAIDQSQVVPDREGPVPDPPNDAVEPHDPIFLVIFTGDLFGHGGFEDPWAIVGVDRIEPRSRRRVQALAGAPPDLLVSRADVDHLVLLDIGHPEDFPDALGQLAETVLAFPKRRLRALAIDKLPDLTADRRQHPEQVFVWLPDLPNKKLEHSQDL